MLRMRLSGFFTARENALGLLGKVIGAAMLIDPLRACDVLIDAILWPIEMEISGDARYGRLLAAWGEGEEQDSRRHI